MEQSLSKKTLDYPKWSSAAQNIFYTLFQSEVDWSICCNWAFARWTSDKFTLDHRPPQPTPEFCRATWRLSASQAAHFSIWYRSLPNLVISQNNPSSLVDASVKLWVVRFPGPDPSCGWRLDCRREWGLGRVEGWAGHTPRTNRPRPLGRPTIRARWEAAAREAVSGETCAADTHSGNRHLSQRDLNLTRVIWVDWETSKFAFLKNDMFSCLYVTHPIHPYQPIRHIDHVIMFYFSNNRPNISPPFPSLFYFCWTSWVFPSFSLYILLLLERPHNYARQSLLLPQGHSYQDFGTKKVLRKASF